TAPYSFAWNNVAAGSYDLTTVATDDQGATGTSAVVSITVNSTSNANPTTSITAPANGASFNEGDNITISADATDTDGTLSKVEFFQGATKLGEDLTAPYSFAWNNVAAGSYDLTTVATDDQGATGTSVVVSITVNSTSNANPTTSITAPANGASFNEGDNISISADASDSDGTVSKVEFFQGATKLGEDLTAPYSFTWNSVAAGNYDLTTVATDDQGATGTSAVVSVTVAAPASGLQAGTIYQITASHSGQSMEIVDAKTDNDAEAVQNHYTGANHQKWELVDAGSGLFKLKALHSNKYLQIKDGKNDEGMEAVQSSSNSSNNQKWDIVALSNGNYKIVNQNSFKALGVLDGKTDDGEKVVQYTYNGNSSMQWSFTSVGSSSKIMTITPDEVSTTLSVFPNPATQFIALEMNVSEVAAFSGQLLSLDGKVIRDLKPETLHKGTHTITIDLSDLQQGVYFLKTSIGDNQLAHRILKK
ncbi:Ig-like domain-containing protein, partial [Marinoscillum furvescens]|uniref:Ig-like domain-containing protein n=1 Tax=Marinoscillum furvescens TaxID=1026 RepID=UPI000E284E68